MMQYVGRYDHPKYPYELFIDPGSEPCAIFWRSDSPDGNKWCNSHYMWGYRLNDDEHIIRETARDQIMHRLRENSSRANIVAMAQIFGDISADCVPVIGSYLIVLHPPQPMRLSREFLQHTKWNFTHVIRDSNCIIKIIHNGLLCDHSYHGYVLYGVNRIGIDKCNNTGDIGFYHNVGEDHFRSTSCQGVVKTCLENIFA